MNPPAYEISTDSTRFDIDFIHRFLSQESYWATGIPRYLVERAIAHSLCFAIFKDGAQIGFARVVSDYTTFAYLADVFIVKSERGKGFSKRLMEAVIAHPDLQGLRRWMLATADAQGLYAQFGFTPLANADRFMERYFPNTYAKL